MGQLFGKNSERIRNELSSGTLRKDFRKLRNESLGRSEMNQKSSERHDSERFRKQSSHRIRKASESVLFPKPFLSFRQGRNPMYNLHYIQFTIEKRLREIIFLKQKIICTLLPLFVINFHDSSINNLL